MAQRGQRTTLSFGGVTAEVSLLKTSGSPREARHDVRRGNAPGPKQQAREQRELQEAEAVKARPPEDHDPLTGQDMSDTIGALHRAAADAPPAPVSAADHAAAQAAVIASPEPEPARQGVWRELGDEDEEWVDLTDRLAAIDATTKLKAMEVVATIPSPSVPRERVRDAHWVALVDPEGARVLALLWHGLHKSGRVAVLRWTKRTNQALGILVARSLPSGKRALLLLELEWAQYMNAPSARVTEPIASEVTDAEQEATETLVLAFAARPSDLDVLRDERMFQRAELIHAARTDTLDEYEPPAPDPAPDESVVAQFAAAATAR